MYTKFLPNQNWNDFLVGLGPDQDQRVRRPLMCLWVYRTVRSLRTFTACRLDKERFNDLAKKFRPEFFRKMTLRLWSLNPYFVAWVLYETTQAALAGWTIYKNLQSENFTWSGQNCIFDVATFIMPIRKWKIMYQKK